MSRLPPEWPQPPKPRRHASSRKRVAGDPATQSTANTISARDPDDGDRADDHVDQSVMGDLPGRAPRDRRWK